jgi:hypothetical protein
MKYKITIEKIDDTSTEKYAPTEVVYIQIVDEDVTEEVICAVNGLTN